MAFLPPVFQALKAAAPVWAIVGGNPPRIYRGAAPPELPATQPRVTWQLVSQAPHNHLSGLPPSDHCVVQVDCWHPEDAGVDRLATAVRDALEPLCHMTDVPVHEREAETRLWRIALQFDWIEYR